MHQARPLRTATLVVASLLLAGASPPLVSSASSPPRQPAERAASVTIAVQAPTRVQARLHGTRVVMRVARSTRLQARTGTAWTVVARARTTRSGAVSYRRPRPSTTTRFRVVAPARTVRLTRTVDGHRYTQRVRLHAWTSAVRTVRPSASGRCTPAPRPGTVPRPGHQKTPWVTGYYAGWDWNNGDRLAPEDVDMSAMTHVVFGRVAPGGGTLGGRPGAIVPGAVSAQSDRPGQAPDGSGRSVEDYLVDRAHRAGTKALLMIGGAGDGAGFMRSTDDCVRPRFVDNLVDHLVAHDYDGVDLDWEDCLEGGAGCGEADPAKPSTASESQRRLMTLIGDIRAEAASRARYAGRPVLITFPGYVLNTNYMLEPGGRAPQWRARVANAVDQYNLMSYGPGTTYNGAGWESWFSGALEGADGQHPMDIASSVDAYVAAGVPRDRIGLGIGFYGIYWGPSITGPRQPTDGNSIWEIDDNALGYGDLDRMGYLDDDNGTRHWDTEARSVYRTYEQWGGAGFVPPVDPTHEWDHTRTPAGFLSYEDEQSIRAKADWVKETGAGGAILWTINLGWVPRTRSNPLLDAVKDAFLG